MVRRLVSFALYQPLFLILLAAIFVAGGIAAFRSLPVEAFPDVADIQATVVTLVPGLAFAQGRNLRLDWTVGQFAEHLFNDGK